MPYLEFPSSLMREQVMERPRLVGVPRSAGRSASGVMMMGRTDGGGLWQYGFSSVALRTSEHVRVWEAIAGYLAEGATPMVVPFCNSRYFPAPTVGGELVYSHGDIPHSDGTFFSDGSGYEQDVVDATVVGLTALRSTTLILRMAYAGDLIGGELFTLDHLELGPRLYRITTIQSVSGTDHTVTIEPPLREEVADDTYVDFDHPRCVMQLNGTMALSLQMRKFGGPSVSFIESFLPEPS